MIRNFTLSFSLTTLLLIFSQLSFAQQTSYLQGMIKDQQGLPIPGATVIVESSAIATQSDHKGYYKLQVNSGIVIIRYRSIGFKSVTKQYTIVTGQNKEANVILPPSDDDLQQVEITGRKEKTYKTTATFLGKTENQLKDIPQSISYASKELIADQGLMRVGEVVKNFSGVNQFSFYDDLTIRGFRVNGQTNTQLINGLRTSTGFWKQSLANYLERVEVLKGPSSALFGNASPGGVVNRVTKKPLDETRRSISFSLGSFNALRALADFTGPATKDSSLLYRVNVGYENSDTFRDLMFDKTLVIAPSLTFIASEKTKINFDLVYTDSKSRLDRGQPVFGTSDLNSTPQSLSLNTGNDHLNELTYNVTLSLNHKMTKHLSLNVAYLKTGYSEDLYEHRTSNAYAVNGQGVFIDNLAGMNIQLRKRKRYIDNLSGYLNYDALTGPVKHNIVLGTDYASEKSPVGGSQLTATGYRNVTNTGAINKFDPSKSQLYLLDGNGNPVPNVPHFNLNKILESQQLQDDSKAFYTQSIVAPAYYYLNAGYLQDQLTLGKLQVLLGLRYEYYTDFANYKVANEIKTHSSALLPRLGFVYSATQNINVYGSYVKGYNPQTAAQISDPNAGGPFNPLESNMVEFGTKSSWLNNQLTVSAALYQINQKGALIPQQGTQVLRQAGRERSRGFELDMIGKILPNWNIIASYSYNRAKILNSQFDSEVGLQKPNAPKNTANLWTRYTFVSSTLKGLGIGAGANFVDKRILIFNKDLTVENQPKLPAYTLFNAALFYNIGKVQLQLNANNITGKKHWVGGYDYLRLFPGTPSNYLLTVGYTF